MGAERPVLAEVAALVGNRTWLFKSVGSFVDLIVGTKKGDGLLFPFSCVSTYTYIFLASLPNQLFCVYGYVYLAYPQVLGVAGQIRVPVNAWIMCCVFERSRRVYDGVDKHSGA